MEARIRIFLFFIVMSSSAAEDVKRNRSGSVGGNITLPDPGVKVGYFANGPNMIANVKNKEILILDENYKDRLLWNRNTEVFTLTGLQRNDSGDYTTDSSTVYKLTVYDPVPAPAVSKLSVSTESCTLLCVVDKAEETTLSWYKDEKIVNESGSAFSLPLTVHKQEFNSSYRCVAANPAEKKSLSVNVTASCSDRNHAFNTDHDKDDDEDKRHHIIGITIPILSVVTVVLAAFIIKRKCVEKNKRTTRETQGSVNTDSEVQYTDIHICEARHNKGGNSPDPTTTVNCSNLITVYDKLECHRMMPGDTDSAENL